VTVENVAFTTLGHDGQKRMSLPEMNQVREGNRHI
jgi:hypothetical protein